MNAARSAVGVESTVFRTAAVDVDKDYTMPLLKRLPRTVGLGCVGPGHGLYNIDDLD